MAKKRAKLVPVQDGRPEYYVELDNSEICDGGGSGGSGLEVIDFGTIYGNMTDTGGFFGQRVLGQSEREKIFGLQSKSDIFIGKIKLDILNQEGILLLSSILTYLKNINNSELSYVSTIKSFIGDIVFTVTLNLEEPDNCYVGVELKDA